jgi:hypothetical protein
MKFEVKKENTGYKVYITVENLSLEEVNERIWELSKAVFGTGKEIGINNNTSHTGIKPNVSVSPEKKNKGRLTEKDQKAIKRQYKESVALIPDDIRETEKERRKVFIKKQLAGKYNCTLTNINYHLNKAGLI